MSRHATTTNEHPRRTRIGRPRQWMLIVAAALALWTTKASAQLDPLLFLKRVAPNIVFVVDLGPGMLSDADGNYYDPYQYRWSNSGGDAAWQTALEMIRTAMQRKPPSTCGPCWNRRGKPAKHIGSSSRLPQGSRCSTVTAGPISSPEPTASSRGTQEG